MSKPVELYTVPGCPYSAAAREDLEWSPDALHDALNSAPSKLPGYLTAVAARAR